MESISGSEILYIGRLGVIISLVVLTIIILILFILLDRAIKEKNKIKKENNKLVTQNEVLESEMTSKENLYEQQKSNIKEQESMLLKKEEILINASENFREVYSRGEASLSKTAKELEEKKEKFDNMIISKLELVSKVDQESAKDLLINEIRESLENFKIKEISEYENKLEQEKIFVAQKYLVSAMEQVAAKITYETSQVFIDLPHEEYKGKLIGKEGRNIRLLQSLLEVDVIVDNTSKIISVSSFNSMRRIIAKEVIEMLIKSGNINQSSIEEAYKLVTENIDVIAYEKGLEAISEFGILEMDNKLVKYLGMSSFRTSLNQNLLTHSMEVAYYCQIIANELHLDTKLAARCGLLHDIGKVDIDNTGRSHIDLGAEYAQSAGENEIIVAAIKEHHMENQSTSIYSTIVKIADTVSASRPGARVDKMEEFLERVEALENLALEHNGVNRAFVLKGGRELRVIVNSDIISDDKLKILSYDLKKEIEEKFSFPGIIKIIVFRELKVIENANE